MLKEPFFVTLIWVKGLATYPDEQILRSVQNDVHRGKRRQLPPRNPKLKLDPDARIRLLEQRQVIVISLTIKQMAEEI